jgi:crotonobetainyl-CoA:carnitine CoA-transferase CaiB-like acyl-CoA transferase
MVPDGVNLGQPPRAPTAPLDGVRVLDLTSVIMGPLATRMLADLGADVIKIEPPEGEMLRSADGARISPMMLNLYRNKRSIVLDLKAAEGRRALDALIPTADVFVHTLRPQVMDRLGFTYARVRTLNPQIIYCAASGFGSDGPYGSDGTYRGNWRYWHRSSWGYRPHGSNRSHWGYRNRHRRCSWAGLSHR